MSTATLADMLTLEAPEIELDARSREALDELVASVTDQELEELLAEGRAAVVKR